MGYRLGCFCENRNSKETTQQLWNKWRLKLFAAYVNT
ncbi:hypothetical protein T09_14670 [Trichinella sp. T9]|nr:hypothetical protein T09_14670 [Trichinella sp. T9]